MEQLAHRIAPAVENSVLYEQAQAEMQVADEVARFITATLDIDHVHDIFANEKLVEFDRVVINLVDLEVGTYALKYHFGPPRPCRPISSVDKLVGSKNHEVVKMSRTLRQDDFVVDPKYPSDLGLAQMGLHSSHGVSSLQR